METSEYKRPIPSDLRIGDFVNQRLRGKGLVIGVTKRTLTVKFDFSTCKWSFKKGVYLIELDGLTKIID